MQFALMQNGHARMVGIGLVSTSSIWRYARRSNNSPRSAARAGSSKRFSISSGSFARSYSSPQAASRGHGHAMGARNDRANARRAVVAEIHPLLIVRPWSSLRPDCRRLPPWRAGFGLGCRCTVRSGRDRGQSVRSFFWCGCYSRRSLPLLRTPAAHRPVPARRRFRRGGVRAARVVLDGRACVEDCRADRPTGPATG